MLKWSVTSLGSSENGYGILSPEHCRIQREPMTVLMLERGEEVFSGALYKTDAFLSAHPFGTVPAAFSPDGTVGVFESNSILRAVARSASQESGLYGEDGYQASRIDSFLDADLVFAREAQVYLLGIDKISEEGYQRMSAAYEFYLSGIEATLSDNEYLAGNSLTIADISFVCDFAQFLREGHYEEQLAGQGLSLISEGGAKSIQEPMNICWS